MEAICAGDYKFEPEQYWEGVSDAAKDFVRSCLTIDQKQRPTAEETLAHPWLSATTPHFVPDPESSEGAPTNLLPNIQQAFNAKKTFRKAVLGMMAVRRLTLSPQISGTLAEEIKGYKEDAEKEHTHEEFEVTYTHGEGEPTPPGSPNAPRPKSQIAPAPPNAAVEPPQKEQVILPPKKEDDKKDGDNVLSPSAQVDATPAATTGAPNLNKTATDTSASGRKSPNLWDRFVSHLPTGNKS